jgi:phosphatidylglycerol:prolipoprotein diacylglycerol transferase
MTSAVQIGPVNLHLYGLILGLAVLVAYEVSRRAGTRHGVAEKDMERVFGWVVMGGLLGARIYHVIDNSEYYSQHWLEIFMLWRGGLGIYGAILGGMIGMGWYLIVGFQRSFFKKKLFKMLDVGAMGLPVGQAVGRWGNYVNQELYGKATNLSWGLSIRGLETKHHPLFFYESVLLVLLFISMLWLDRKKGLPFGRGAYFGVYAIGYGFIRFGLEYLRVEPWRAGLLTVAQWMSVGFILTGILMLRRIWAKD